MMVTLMLLISLLGVLGLANTENCPDTRPTAYYNCPGPGTCDDNDAMTAGIPSGFSALGADLTACELYELQTYCVDAINNYRTTNPNFSDGTFRQLDENLHLMKNPDTSFLQCMNEKALSDLKYAESEVCFGSPCGCKNSWSGAAWHITASYDCDLGSGSGNGYPVVPDAENTCCERTCDSLATCKLQLDGCLSSMYDEGIEYVTGGGGVTGHYDNMVSSEWTHVVCGFGFTDDGAAWMNQDFFGTNFISSATWNNVEDLCQYDCDDGDGSGKCSCTSDQTGINGDSQNGDSTDSGDSQGKDGDDSGNMDGDSSTSSQAPQAWASVGFLVVALVLSSGV